MELGHQNGYLDLYLDHGELTEFHTGKNASENLEIAWSDLGKHLLLTVQAFKF